MARNKYKYRTHSNCGSLFISANVDMKGSMAEKPTLETNVHFPKICSGSETSIKRRQGTYKGKGLDF